MKKGFVLCFCILLASLSNGQWHQLSSPEIFTVHFLVAHKDKAYAAIEGKLCAGDREAEDRYAFYPVDINSSGLSCGTSWEDFFITGSNGSVVSVYSDVSIAQKLKTRSLSAGKINCVFAKDNVILAGTYNGVYRSGDTLKSMHLVSPVELKGVNQFAVAGSKWFTATDKGIFSSQDQGASWQVSGLPNTIINSIEFLDDTVYAASNSSLYISDDAGQSWKVHPEFTDEKVIRLILNENILFVNTLNGLYKKMSGEAVQAAFLGMAGEYTGCIQLGRTSLISSYWGLVFRDNQDEWTPVLSPVSYEARVQVFAGNENVLLAGTDTRGLFASFDRGDTWIMRSPPFDFGSVYGILSASIIDGYWFCSTVNGAYRTGDQGTTWILKNNGLSDHTNVNSYFKNESRLWLSTNKGLYYSTNYGDTWIKPANGIDGQVFQVEKNRSGKLFASSESGLYESHAPYEHWTLASFQSLNPFYGLATYSDTLYASTKGSGIFQSSNGGATWTAGNDGLQNQYLGKIAADDSHAVVVNGVGDIYVKRHNENSWSRFNHTLEVYSGIAALMVINDTVYVGAGFDGVHKRALSDHSPVLGIMPSKSKDYKSYAYPNPASEEVYFKNPEQIEFIEFLDQHGKLIVQTEINKPMNVIEFAPGWYYVKIYWKDESISVEKLVKP